jgi:hypothetical protein
MTDTSADAGEWTALTDNLERLGEFLLGDQ